MPATAVTALYELVPAGKEADASQPQVDDLKYQTKPKPTEAADSDEMMTLKLRYKQPDGDTSTLVEIPVENKASILKKPATMFVLLLRLPGLECSYAAARTSGPGR